MKYPLRRVVLHLAGASFVLMSVVDAASGSPFGALLDLALAWFIADHLSGQEG